MHESSAELSGGFIALHATIALAWSPVQVVIAAPSMDRVGASQVRRALAHPWTHVTSLLMHALEVTWKVSLQSASTAVNAAFPWSRQTFDPPGGPPGPQESMHCLNA
jgi:hypothetical protein